MTYKEKWIKLKDYLEYFVKKREIELKDKEARTCIVNVDNLRNMFWEAVVIESEKNELQTIRSIITTMECFEGK